MTGVFGLTIGASKIQQTEVRSARDKTPGRVASATDRAVKPPIVPPTLTESEIARRAYALYLSCGCEHGRDIDDWLQAERELRFALSTATDCLSCERLIASRDPGTPVHASDPVSGDSLPKLRNVRIERLLNVLAWQGKEMPTARRPVGRTLAGQRAA